MPRYALVVGSETEGLQGVERDAERMKAALVGQPYGFDVDFRVGANATRAAILGAYDALIARCGKEDTAVVYYAGHGGYVVNTQYRASRAAGIAAPRAYQFIVPTDYRESTDDDFRGITSVELSLKLQALTERTRNVTVILDCCHSAQLSRDAAARTMRARALPHPQALGIDKYIDALKEQGARFDGLDIESNPNAVRLAGAGATQSSYEYVNDKNECVGLMTESLIKFMGELGGDGNVTVTWEALGNAVRERVLRIIPEQRPEIEGPTRRALFSLEEPAASHALPVVQQGANAVLRGGSIGGVGPGDLYGIMPAGSAAYEKGRAIASARVLRVTATRAEARLEGWTGAAIIPDGARAFPLEKATERRAVAVRAEGDALRAIVAALEGSQRLRAARGDEEPLATLVEKDGELTLLDRWGPIFPPTRSVSTVIHDLGNQAVAQDVRELEGAHGLLPESAEIEWGVVENGKARALASSGELLTLADRVYLRIRNRSKERRYFHIFDVGVRGKVSLLTSSAPSGVALDSDEEYTLGEREGRGLVGLKLAWPEGLAADQPRREELMVIGTQEKADLRVLETDDLRTRGASRGGTPLARLFAQLQSGRTRDLGDDDDVDKYFARRIQFLLNPSANYVPRGASFLVDLQPSPTLVAFQGSAAPARRRISIRLVDSFARAAESPRAPRRLDALVCTRGRSGMAPYHVETFRFSNIDEGSLSLSNTLIYEGDADSFVDIALWASPDTRDGLPLRELLRTRLDVGSQSDADAAIRTLGSPERAADALGAASALSHVVESLLREVNAGAAGIFRTTLLAQDDFGIGRPLRDLRAADGISFGIRVEAAS